jgi:pilus assembly protein Flp/PilA
MFNWILGHTVRLCGDKRGVTMLEYGVIAALIAAVCVRAVATLGTDIEAKFNTIAGSI